MHADDRKKDILVLGEGPTDELDKTSITEEAKYSFNISKSKKKNCLSLQYNVANSLFFVYGMKIHQFKPKDSEIKPHLLCLGNISKTLQLIA